MTTNEKMSASDQKRRLSDLERGTPPACEQSHVPKVPRVDTLYTIFFVAATTIFSFSHSVGHEGYRFLAAFFVVTWSTWFQVMLYRSSFGVGDITDGLAYAAQFLYMTLFGALAVQRYTRNTEVVLMLMVVLSRFALGLQYLRALWLAPGGSESRSRMLKVMLRTKVVSVVLLLLLDQGWWYAVLVIEAIVDAMIHGLGREATDEDVVGQRMRNLTLVMLAGSVLVVGREFVDLGLPNTLKLSVLEWSNINCFILTIFFIHVIYFSSQKSSHGCSGAVWTVSHLLFHLTFSLYTATLAPAVIVAAKLSWPGIATVSVTMVAFMLALLQASSKSRKQITRRDSVRIALLLMLALTILSATFVRANRRALVPWELPIAMLGFGAVALVDSVWERTHPLHRASNA